MRSPFSLFLRLKKVKKGNPDELNGVIHEEIRSGAHLLV